MKLNMSFLQPKIVAMCAPLLYSSRKSEDVPEKNDGPVVKLVGENFKGIVEDPTKDVFVKYYAPWCGHCKTIAPKWAELG